MKRINFIKNINDVMIRGNHNPARSMKEMSIQKLLNEIELSQNFEQLEQCKDSKNWSPLSLEDKERLASLFFLQGEMLLTQGDANAEKSFDCAFRLLPENPQIYRRIGNVYASLEGKMEFLARAVECFQSAVRLEPSHIPSRLTLGCVLNRLGEANHDVEMLNLAKSTFETTLTLEGNATELERAHLRWYYAISDFSLGKLSGEAVDFHKSILNFQKASELGLQDKYFWKSFGDALVEFASLTKKEELFLNVVEIYRNSIRQAFDFFDGWLSLACTFQHLFDTSFNEEYFHQAFECFKMASQISSEHSILWFKWAQLSAAGGKLWHKTSLLETALQKFEKADRYDSNNPIVLAMWSEALLLLGAQSERIELLKEAHAKILSSIEKNPRHSEAWYIHGCCLYEFGRYFGAEDHYHHAIDKFQFGLSLKQNEPLLWYGLAVAHFAVGDLRGDANWLERSLQFFGRVLEFKAQGYRPMWNDWGLTHLRLAEITGDKAHVNSALEKFEHVIGSNPADWEENEVDPEWLYNYGCALDLLGDLTDEAEPYERAILVLSSVVRNDTQHIHARYNLALAFAHLGDLLRDVDYFHKSIEQFQILIGQDNEDEQAWADYGVTIMHLAQLTQDPHRPEQLHKLYEISESKLSQAVALGSIHAFYHLACLYSLQGNMDATLNFLERAEAADALPSIDQLLHDEWLELFRETEQFRHFLNHVQAKHLHDRIQE